VIGGTALGAGDLIDRAVRFYRANFWTLVLIAAPPVVVGTLISVGWTLVARSLFSVSPGPASAEYFFYVLFVGLGNASIWFAETVCMLSVMGGASRNFVRHLLFGEAITFRETYRNTLGRLWGLVGASALITVLVGLLGIAIFYIVLIAVFIGIALIASTLSPIPVLAVIVSIVWGLAAVFGGGWVFLLAASRVAYVPQVMLVEGQGVFSAIGRSMSLAGRSVRRLGALFAFTILAAYSALALLYVPLAWYASANGVELMSFGSQVLPAWYEISYKLIWELSLILLTPVWMIGLCLLYVDERVRTEAYDIELMAAARLGDIPVLPQNYSNPLQPALAVRQDSPPRGSFTTLGLK